jgi:hypothetical protein
LKACSSELDGQEEARQGVGLAVGATALPDALGCGGEAGDGEVGVEVLSELGDHPIGVNGPGVHPVHGPFLRLGDHRGAEGVDGPGDEPE